MRDRLRHRLPSWIRPATLPVIAATIICLGGRAGAAPTSGAGPELDWTRVSIPVGDEPRMTAVADFDGDARLDLAVALDGPSTVAVRFGGGDGSFGPVQSYAGPESANAIVAMDFDADADVDLIATGSGNFLRRFRNLGDGTFEILQDTFIGFSVFDNPILPADIDGDGSMDFAIFKSLTDTISVFQNDETGEFQPAVNISLTPGTGTPALRDVNEDGLPDIVASNVKLNDVGVRFGIGGGFFGPPTRFPVASTPTIMTVADVDGDLDWVTPQAGSVLTIGVNDGTGAYTTIDIAHTYPNVNAVTAGDVNGDGIPDMALGGPIRRFVGVLLGSGDVTGDVVVDFDDLLAVLASFGAPCG